MSPDDGINVERVGEIFNLSMSSATSAVSSVVEKEVEISKIDVDVNDLENIDFSEFEPAILAQYDFTSGASGKSTFLFKKEDIREIVGAILQQEFSEEDFEFDEISISVINEVLTPLAEKCYTSVSNFVDKDVKVTEPQPSEVVDTKTSLKDIFTDNQKIVKVDFKFVIAETVDSKMSLILNEQQANDFSSTFNEEEEQDEQPVISQSGTTNSYYNAQPTQHVGVGGSVPQENKSTNLDVILNVPLQVSVEMGKTKKQIKDILEFVPGSIIELDKPASSPVDVCINGKLIAKGDVVAVDEYYGIKISEIINSGEIMKIL